MKSCIFLIILLDFIRIAFFCSQPENVTEDVCPVKWFRRKRAIGEYTRWKSNIETTPEFIVKVLDDETLAGTTNQLVAGNSQPPNSRDERIIVGGAMVPPPLTSPSTIDLLRDYTRFVPPTTASVSLDKNQYIASTVVTPRDILTMRPDQLSSKTSFAPPFLPPYSVRNVYRDESPPVSPQFLSRTRPPAAPQRQYAPIAPVAFTRQTTGTPLTPPYDNNIQYPSRSPPPFIPSRTPGILDKLEKLQDFPMLDALMDDEVENQLVVTKTSLQKGPSRSTHYQTSNPLFNTNVFDDEFEHFHTRAMIKIGTTTQNIKEIDSGSDSEDPNSKTDHTDGDKDTNYNMFFYNSDYKDSKSKNESDYVNKSEYDDKIKQDNPFATNPNEPVASDELFLEESNNIDAVDNKTVDKQYDEANFKAKTVNATDTTESTRHPTTSKDLSSREGLQNINETETERDCDMIKLRPLNFNAPRTLPEIVDQLKQWTDESPVVRWADITGGNLTTMENPIYVMIVDDPSVGQVASEKLNVLLVAGIHGRDHHSVTAAMYILYQLIERSETHYDLLSKYRFWIIPVFNPDGYDYSMTFPHKRNWVKNLRQTWDDCKGRDSCKHCSTYGIRCTISPCYGVNLDRNFEYQWIPARELRAEHPCGNLYAGTRQMSEVETQSLSNYIQQQDQQHMVISSFIAFKEGDVLGVMYPYSHTKKRRAFDQIYRQRAGRAAAAAYSIAGRKYVAGQTSEFLPLYAGGIEDWIDGHLIIDNTYTIMMFRPTDTAKSKYLTERVIHEAYAAMDSLLLASLVQKGGDTPRVALAKKNKASSVHHILKTVLIASLSSLVYSHYFIYKNTIS